MCGIVGYVGNENAVSYLINGLKKLEYRGYDSSGIVVGKFENNEPKFYLYKKSGKLTQLVGALPKELSGSWGIGHTRWATHGLVTDQNAHPLMGNKNKVVAVHNGIIENFQTLKNTLKNEGVVFSSETDSEVIPNLVEKYYQGDLLSAVQEALKDVVGTYALAITCIDEPNKIVVAKHGGPIVIGLSEEAYYIASDVNAIVGNTNRVIYLEDGDIVEITPNGLKFPKMSMNDYSARVESINIDANETEKCGYETYMEKEIEEQPESIERAFAGRIDMENATAKLSGFEDDIFKRTKRICCMSAYIM